MSRRAVCTTARAGAVLRRREYSRRRARTGSARCEGRAAMAERSSAAKSGFILWLNPQHLLAAREEVDSIGWPCDEGAVGLGGDGPTLVAQPVIVEGVGVAAVGAALEFLHHALGRGHLAAQHVERGTER